MPSSKRVDEFSSALSAAARYTHRGVRSANQVRAYLTQRKVSPAIAERVLAACRFRHLIDDHACARLWADHWARAGFAWSAIRGKLAVRGLDEHVIAQAASWLAHAADDEARARAVAARVLQRGRAHPQQRARVARTLESRGFDANLVERILNESFGTLHSDAES